MITKAGKINKVVSKLTWLRLTRLQISLLILGMYFSKKTLIEIAKKQTLKGIDKYGKTILDCNFDDYDWLQMAGEEFVDGIFYILKHKKII